MREFSLNNLVTHCSACNNGKLSYILKVCGSVGGALRSTTCRERTPRAAVRRISRRLSRWTKFLAGIYSFLLYIYIFIYVYNYMQFFWQVLIQAFNVIFELNGISGWSRVTVGQWKQHHEDYRLPCSFKLKGWVWNSLFWPFLLNYLKPLS